MKLRWMPVLLILLPGLAIAADSQTAAKVREIMSHHIKPNGPGAAVAVVRNGEVIFAEGFGLSHIDQNVPIRPATTFDLASCSKQFTAMAIMILADRGKLTFNDDARRFLPELPPRESRPIRIADLLHMTSGLPDYTSLMDNLADKTNTDVLRRIARDSSKFPPGEKFDYSNTNYALLALIVERASNRPFAQFMAEEIFTPAGMTETVILESPGQAVKHRAMGYAQTKSGFNKSRNDTKTIGDGQVMSSVIDLARWDKALREEKFVKHETQLLAYTPGKLDNGKSSRYGFGWFIGKNHVHPYIDHEGGWSGTNTYIRRDLDTGLTVIVLSNNENFGADTVGIEIEQAIAGTDEK